MTTDTHVHLESLRDPQNVIRDAKDAGIRLIAMTRTPSEFRALFPAFGRRHGVRLALGFHPMAPEVAAPEVELELLAKYSGHTSFIGEVGIDRSHESRSHISIQTELFRRVLSTAEISEKILSIHSRGATSEVLDCLQDADAKRPILHWFTGPQRDAARALELGCYFSVNTDMLRSDRSRRVIQLIPANRLLLESDAPYTRDHSAGYVPAALKVAASELASLIGISPAELHEQMEASLRHLGSGVPGLAGAS